MDRRQTGIIVRGNSVQISFTYMGQRCRETIRVKPTETVLKEITRKREAILYAIDMGTFDYADHFPNSKNALKYSRRKGSLVLVKDALNQWLIECNQKCERSTIRSYSKIVQNQLIPDFGNLTLSDVTPAIIREWRTKQNCSNKRINNILSPLRQVFKQAYFDELIDSNPFERISNLKVETREANPFTINEINLILKQLTGQERNLIEFAFWSGLRTSELIALRWEDIDFDNNRFYVRQAKVYGKIKTTKTKSSIRTVELQPAALKALQNQKKSTQYKETVFTDKKTGKSWQGDQPIRKRVWIPALNKAGLMYRNPYQTRHTFASILLSRGENPLWVAEQMGHKDWGMIRKIYGRWIN